MKFGVKSKIAFIVSASIYLLLTLALCIYLALAQDDWVSIAVPFGVWAFCEVIILIIYALAKNKSGSGLCVLAVAAVQIGVVFTGQLFLVGLICRGESNILLEILCIALLISMLLHFAVQAVTVIVSVKKFCLERTAGLSEFGLLKNEKIVVGTAVVAYVLSVAAIVATHGIVAGFTFDFSLIALAIYTMVLLISACIYVGGFTEMNSVNRWWVLAALSVFRFVASITASFISNSGNLQGWYVYRIAPIIHICIAVIAEAVELFIIIRALIRQKRESAALNP